MLKKLLVEIKKYTHFPLVIIGIDGPGGVGKTTYAQKIKQELPLVQIVHMDDFDVLHKRKMNHLSTNRPVGPDTEWQRVISEVFLPLKSGKNASFKPYDRSLDAYRGEIVIKPKGIVIIEGVFAVRRELFSYFDFTIWMECSLKTRVKRALLRDGEEARELWEKDWLPMEDKYMSIYSPKSYVDYIFKTE